MSFVPLTQAITSGDANAVKAVLANGADVNERTAGGQTPLILATIVGHTHLVPLLLDAGADPQLRDNLGLNAIDWAQRRGATEVIEVLNNNPGRTPVTRSTTRPQTPPARSLNFNDAERSSGISEEDRSRRWIAGLKQRIAEQAQREVPDGPNIFRPQATAEPFDSQSWLASLEHEPQPEIPAEPSTPQTELPATSPEPQPEIPAPPPDPQHDLPEPTQPEPESPTEPSGPEIEAQAHARRFGRYGPEPAPVISQPQSTSPLLFWMIIIATLIGSLVVGSLVTGFFNKPAPVQQARVTASAPAPRTIQKGTPVADKELEGKVLSLPNAEAPLKGQVAIPGTVVVRVTVNRTGQVTKAQASGGDWLLRGAASEAAMKSTFAPEKLRRRTTQGTITYTFEP